MAITNSDGSIILSTKVDTSGINKGMSKMQGKAASLTKTFSKLGAAIASAFAIQKIIQFSDEAGKLATQTEASVQRLIDIYGQASDSVGDFIDANARALGMSKAAAASYASVYGNLFSVWADQKTNAELTNHYLNMTAVVASKTGRTVADVQERIRSGLLGNTEAIEDLGIFVNVKTIEITDAFKRIADGRSWEQLTAYEQSQVRTLAILEQSTKKYGTQVADTTQSVRIRFRAAYEEFKNTWGQLVNTVLIPVLSTLTKIFSVATAVINTLTGNTGKIMGDSPQAEITGQIKDNILESTDNQEEFTGAIEETNKELKRTLAGFDDLQILSSSTELTKADGASDIDGNMGELGGLELPALPQMGQQDNFDPMGVVSKIKDALDFILPVISISLVVIGLILLSAGQIGWGIGFIIAGAYIYSVIERSGEKAFDFSIVKQDLYAILPYIDEALVAIGLILMFLGQIPIGIGFIIVGAIVYGAQEVSTEDYDGADVKTKLATITEAVSLSLAAIGIILIFFGKIPLGIGFIVAGKKLLDVSEEQLKEGEITTKIQKFFDENEELFVKIGAGMVLLGILLLFVPSAFQLALSLIATGAVGIVATKEITDEPIIEMMSDFLSENTLSTLLIGAGLVIIGIILCLSGLGIGVGFAMIAEGAVAIYGAASTNGEQLKTELTGWFQNYWTELSIVGGVLLILGIIVCITGVGIGVGITIIAAGAGLLYGVTVSNWDAIKKEIAGFVNNVMNWISENPGTLLVIGLILCTTVQFFGVGITLVGIAASEMFGGGLATNSPLADWAKENMNQAIEEVKLGAEEIQEILSDLENQSPLLPPNFNSKSPYKSKTFPGYARGTVIPPNKPHLAWLGDNTKENEIVSPVSTMKQAFVEAMIEMGGNFVGGNTEVVLEIDGREFGRAVVEQGNRENRRIGTRLVIV